MRLAGHLPAVSQAQQNDFREISEMLASVPDGPIREQAMVAIRAIVRDAYERAERERMEEAAADS